MEPKYTSFRDQRALPLMALRGITVFPEMILNFDVERSASIAALNRAMRDDQMIFLVGQRDIAIDVPSADELYSVGTVCRIKQMMKQPGTKLVRVMVEGI